MKDHDAALTTTRKRNMEFAAELSERWEAGGDVAAMELSVYYAAWAPRS